MAAPVDLPPVLMRPGGYRFLPDGSGLVHLPRIQALDFWLLDFATGKTGSSRASSNRGARAPSTSHLTANRSSSTARGRTPISSCSICRNSNLIFTFAQLDLTSIGHRTRDLPGRRQRRFTFAGAAEHHAIGNREVGSVEDVERFDSKLDRTVVSEEPPSAVLDRGQIDVDESWSGQHVAFRVPE